MTPSATSSQRAEAPGGRLAGLVSHGWLAAIVFAYLYLFPYFPRISSANELPRVYLVKAIVEDQTFAIDRGVATWGTTVDVSPSGGHLYSNKAPGSSLLAVPAYAIVRAIAGEPALAPSVWICRVFGGILPMLGFVWLLWGFLARFAPEPAVRRVVLLGYALGSLAMTYSMLFYSHQLGAICIASAWIVALDVADGRRGLAAMAVAGLLAGAAPLVDYQAVFAGLPVASHVVVRLVPIAVLLGYHAACFGSPWRTGYDASTTFAVYHQHGFLGLTELRGEALWGALMRRDNGLFALSPWWLIALPGLVTLWLGRERGTALVGAAVIAIYVLFISSINFWRGGWEVGPRYITAMLPFLLPAVAAQLQAWRVRPFWFGLAAGLTGVGVVVYVLATATFPYWPDYFQHPLYEITFRLLRDNLVGPSLGSALGIAGIAGIAPVLAVVAAALGAAVWRSAGARSLALAVGVAGAVLLGYGWIHHGGPRADAGYRYVHAAVVDL
ncbi:MAG: hypothetical protein E6J90_44920 [Deltaproteobacteria bacterium]|nr:MAG: hypothetical protein E6J90_44920 [Deltaproteobacteria bacterium]